MKLYKLSLYRSKIVFFQNPDDLDLFVRGNIVKQDLAKLLPGSGVDLNYFRPQPRRVDCSNGATILFVGRFLRDKGIIEFVEAARKIKRSGGRIRAQLLGFVDVSNPTAIHQNEIESWVSEGVVEYLGASDDVRPAIAMSDCVALPSYREGAPRTLIEAAAMAKPLIATDVPGCKEVVIDGQNGYLCRPQCGHDLERAIRKFLALTDDERYEMGAASRLLAESKFDEKFVISSYINGINE